MRKKLKEVFKQLLEQHHKVVIVDNDFEAAYNIKPIEIDRTLLLEAIYILLAILAENEINIEVLYGVKK